jgi:hypothetical protein
MGRTSGGRDEEKFAEGAGKEKAKEERGIKVIEGAKAFRRCI